jgi:hypothetical protein
MPYDINFNEIFDDLYLNRSGQYIVTNDELFELVDDYIVKEDFSDIKKYVSNFGIFNAIELYEDRYGNDYVLDLKNKYKMYLQLAYVIIMDIIETAEMTEDRQYDENEEDTDDDTDETDP